MCCISTAMQDFFFWACDGGVSAIQASDNSQAVVSLGRNCSLKNCTSMDHFKVNKSCVSLVLFMFPLAEFAC
jgi:hypothetical protein